MSIRSHWVKQVRPEWFATGRPARRQAGSSNILIADDHAGSRLGLRIALEAAGYEVSEAEDGSQALEFLRSRRVDLALLDLRMPGLDGTEVIRRMRDEGIHVPVVVITAHPSLARAHCAMELGALDFLSKPVEPALLREAVHDAIRRRDPVEPRSSPAASLSLGPTVDRFGETLAVARRAFQLGRLELAEYLLQKALDINPDSADANALRGALREELGEHHAAYQCYRRALLHDPRHRPALDGMMRYCQRYKLDPRNRAINPAED